MRKSLGPPPKKMRDLFSDLSDEEETTADDELIPDEDEEPDGA
jgi:hypothetical protein